MMKISGKGDVGEKTTALRHRIQSDQAGKETFRGEVKYVSGLIDDARRHSGMISGAGQEWEPRSVKRICRDVQTLFCRS